MACGFTLLFSTDALCKELLRWSLEITNNWTFKLYCKTSNTSRVSQYKPGVSGSDSAEIGRIGLPFQQNET